MVIWNSLLPHGAGVNRSPQPRVVQYVNLTLSAAVITGEMCEGHQRFHAERTGSPRLGMPPESGGPTVFHSARARCLAGLEAWPVEMAGAPRMERLPGSATFIAGGAAL